MVICLVKPIKKHQQPHQRLPFQHPLDLHISIFVQQDTGDHQIVGSTALEGTALVQPEPRVLPGDEIRQGIRQTKVGQNPGWLRW